MADIQLQDVLDSGGLTGAKFGGVDAENDVAIQSDINALDYRLQTLEGVAGVGGYYYAEAGSYANATTTYTTIIELNTGSNVAAGVFEVGVFISYFYPEVPGEFAAIRWSTDGGGSWTEASMTNTNAAPDPSATFFFRVPVNRTSAAPIHITVQGRSGTASTSMSSDYSAIMVDRKV